MPTGRPASMTYKLVQAIVNGPRLARPVLLIHHGITMEDARVGGWVQY